MGRPIRMRGLGPVAYPRANLHGEWSDASRNTPRRRACQVIPFAEAFCSAEPLIVSRWSVDRRHGLVEQPQVHRELTSMVGEVVQRIAQDDLARLVHHDLA